MSYLDKIMNSRCTADNRLHPTNQFSWHNPENMEQPDLSFIQYDTHFLHKEQMVDGLEDYWQPWETGPHWELKREFIEAYKNMFEKQRLLCLAQAYSNVILMNCQYPDPVMRQISELAKPLQMRKRFQNVNWNTGIKRSINQQEIERTNSMYEHYERPFKQTKISSNEGQSSSAFLPTSTPVLQASMKQLVNSHPMFFCNKNNSEITSELEQSSELSSSSSFDVNSKLEPLYKIKDIFIEKEKEEKVISALGLPFIQKFTELVKNAVYRFSIPIEIIQSTLYKLGYRNYGKERVNTYHIEIEKDPETPATYYSRFYINNCEVCSETSINKKKAKALVAEAAINTLVKLSTSTFNKTKSHNSVNKFRTIVHKTVRKSSNSMKVFEIFQRNIMNRTKVEPALVTLKSIASLLDMEDYISFETDSDAISPTEIVHSCKFFLNDMLISQAKDETSLSAKSIAVELGLLKLSNLEQYEIRKGGLKLKIKDHDESVNSYTKKTCFDVGTKNLEKPPFILNKVLYEASLNDKFLVMERDSHKFNIEKDVRLVVAASANFSRRKFEFVSEDVPGAVPPLIKIKVLVGNEVAGVGVDYRKDIAKTIACCKAFIDMKRKYYTIRVKDEYIDGFLVTRDQVFQGEPYTKNVIKKSYANVKRIKKRKSDKRNFNNRVEGTDEKSSITDTCSQPTEPSVTNSSSQQTILPIADKNSGLAIPSIIDSNSQSVKPAITDTSSQPAKPSTTEINSQPAKPSITETNSQPTTPSTTDASSQPENLSISNESSQPAQPLKPHNLYLFREKVEILLKEFSESEDYCDLMFSEEFSPVEKKEIHRIGRKCHLRPGNFQEEEEDMKKFMCLRHQYNVPKLLNYLVNNNGSSCKFELIDGSVTKYDL